MNKLIIFTGTLSHGGSERVISILVKLLANKFKEIEIITFYDLPIWYEFNENIKITVLGKDIKYRSKLSKILQLRKYIINQKPDSVISFLAPFNIYITFCLLFSGIPLIVAERNDPRYIPNKSLIRFLRNFAYIFVDKIIVQTENNKNYFNKILREKTIVIYNPVDLGEYRGRALCTVKEDKIVSVGRLIEQKNQKMLISAFSEILKDFPDYKLEIYGEGNLRAELENEVKKLNLESKIYFLGARKDVLDEIINSKAFILTSNFEGMPNALIEAMCLGIPCISTKVSGAVDLIDHNTNGLLVEKGDVLDLVNQIKRVIVDKEFSNTLSVNATKLNDLLSLNEIEKKWLEVLSVYKMEE